MKWAVYPAAATLAIALPAVSGRAFTLITSIPGTQASFSRLQISSDLPSAERSSNERSSNERSSMSIYSP